MKYRITSFTVNTVTVPRHALKLRAKGRIRELCVLPPIPYGKEPSHLPPTELSPAPLRSAVAKKVLREKLKRLYEKLRVLAKAIRDIQKAAVVRWLHTPSYNAFLGGALCSALCIAVFSASVVILTLFFPYLAPYESITVPSFEGLFLTDVEAQYGEKLTLLVSYEHSEDIPAGAVISQAPQSGVERRLYKKGLPPTLTLKVSLGRSYYQVEELSGKNERDALLDLRNAGVRVNTVYQYSDTVQRGKVLSTSPSAGQLLFGEEALTLTVSLGRLTVTVRVPDLYGLTEAQATAVLREKGLNVGKIDYKSSSAPAGTVIIQSSAPYSELSPDCAVDITVSLGHTAPQRFVPNLYGLTVEEAVDALASVGLVIGGIFPVSCPAPLGTVITQGIAAGTPITPSITSVDIYISS